MKEETAKSLREKAELGAKLARADGLEALAEIFDCAAEEAARHIPKSKLKLVRQEDNKS